MKIAKDEIRKLADSSLLVSTILIQRSSAKNVSKEVMEYYLSLKKTASEILSSLEQDN